MQAATTLTPNALLYLYGLVAPSTDRSAIAGLAADDEIFTLDFGHVTCVAGVVDADDYRQPAGATAAAQLEWLGPRAVRHHQIVRRLHAIATTVPFKFGTMCASATDLEAALSDRRDAIADLFRRLDRKDEWTLRMTADADRLAASFAETEPDLVAIGYEAATAAPGRAYFLRKKLQIAAAERVADRMAAVQMRIDDRLVRLGVETIDHDSSSARGSSIDTTLLVDRDRFGDLEAYLAELESEHADTLTFELIGPWPPYSFASVSV